MLLLWRPIDWTHHTVDSTVLGVWQFPPLQRTEAAHTTQSVQQRNRMKPMKPYIRMTVYVIYTLMASTDYLPIVITEFL